MRQEGHGVYLGKGANNVHAAGSLDAGLRVLRYQLFKAQALSSSDSLTLTYAWMATLPSRQAQ